MSAELNGYTKWPFPHDGVTHDVYSTGNGPNVVVLHELPGLTASCLKLGLVLAKEVRAQVHLPLLFGPREPTPLERLKNTAKVICISKEIYRFASNETSPIVSWCRALCDELKSKNPSSPGVGVVGMCLTGGFALALIANDSVNAAVVAQPSLPLFVHRSSLGLSTEDAEAAARAAARDGSECVLGLRHKFDLICPASRMATIKQLLGTAFREVAIPGCGHSTLTARDSEEALRETVLFLSNRLKTRG